jgi:hypothetical protein
MKLKWENYGSSSLTIVAVIAGLDIKYPCIPHDPSDFNRCIHLFECLDYTENKMYATIRKIAEIYPIWKPISDNWIELKELYDQERKQDNAPKLYNALKVLRK